MAQKIYGIDFGTDTIKIYKKGQGIILIEKNVVSTVGKGSAEHKCFISVKSWCCIKDR